MDKLRPWMYQKKFHGWGTRWLKFVQNISSGELGLKNQNSEIPGPSPGFCQGGAHIQKLCTKFFSREGAPQE